MTTIQNIRLHHPSREHGILIRELHKECRERVLKEHRQGKRISKNSVEDYPELYTVEQIDLDTLKAPQPLTIDLFLSDTIISVLNTLTKRERDVLINRFGLFGEAEHTFEGCGKLFNVSRDRIRKITLKALRKLRHPSRLNKLQPFIDDLIETS